MSNSNSATNGFGSYNGFVINPDNGYYYDQYNYNSQNGVYDFSNQAKTNCMQSSYLYSPNIGQGNVINNNLPGGYSGANLLPRDVIRFLRNIYDTTETSLLAVYNIQEQVVAGRNYKMTIKLLYKSSCKVTYYNVTLQQNLQGEIIVGNTALIQ